MPLEFSDGQSGAGPHADRRVGRFQDYNTVPLFLDGSYFLVLRGGSNHPVRFRLPSEAPVVTAAGASQAVVRNAPPTVARIANGSSTPITPSLENGFWRLPPANDPCYDAITYGSAAGPVHYNFWYLQGHITVRTHGPPSPANSAWPAAVSALTGGLSTTAVTHLGHDTCATFARSVQGTRYYFGIEFDGEILPHDAPGRYCFPRWAMAITIFRTPSAPGVSGSSATRSGEDARRDAPAQVMVPTAGRVYATDGPGSAIIAATDATVGTTEFYAGQFRQRLVVGDSVARSTAAPPDNPGTPWADSERQPETVLAETSWQVAMNYTVTANGSATVAPSIARTAGFRFVP